MFPVDLFDAIFKVALGAGILDVSRLADWILTVGRAALTKVDEKMATRQLGYPSLTHDGRF